MLPLLLQLHIASASLLAGSQSAATVADATPVGSADTYANFTSRLSVAAATTATFSAATADASLI